MDRAEQLAEAVADLLRRLVRERLARTPGGYLVEAQLEQIELRVPVALRGSQVGPRRLSHRLLAEIDGLLDEAVRHAAAFRPGHAWCHRCRCADCGHTAPPSCRHVFSGYGPTGMPLWEDFAQLCLDRRHPEVDRLFDQPPVLLTVVQLRQELHGGILDAFRHRSYELLGQVAAGFYAVPARAHEGRGVVALSVQVAASRRRGGWRLGLNMLGRTPAGEGLDLLWERQQDLPWRGALRWAQAALRRLEGAPALPRSRRRHLPRAELERRVGAILRGLARRLERDRRARARRTRHAEQRHLSGHRPTRKALDDARAAKDSAVLIDERSGALVVLGERGRTHFFTDGGRLVSSVRYSPEAIQRKLKGQKWRPATSVERAALRRNLG